MKHLKFIVMMLVAANVAFISSCSKDDESSDDATTPKPTVTVVELSNSGSEFTVAPGTPLTFAWDAIKPGDGRDLDVFSISTSGVNSISPIPDSKNGNSFPYTVKNADDERYIDTIEVAGNQNLNEGITTYTFMATDKDGNSASASITVTVEVPVTATPLATEVTSGVINNLIGPDNSVWDLVADASKPGSSPDAEKDMQNTTTTSSTAPEIFESEWEAMNDTRFVKVTGQDYDNATEEAAIAAYAGGTPTATVSNVTAGDQYVAKLRGTDDYVLIEITNVDVTTGDNSDKIEFKYKKK